MSLAATTGLANYAKRAVSQNDERFPDPFMDMASLAMPEGVREALLWCEFIMQANGVYRQAVQRVLSYFITDIEVVAANGNKLGREERDKVVEFLEETIGIKTVLPAVGLDYLTYGNSFTSVMMPFRRYLSCPRCGLELPLKKVYNTAEFGFRWTNFEFHAHCPGCHFTGAWKHVDRRAGEQGDIKIKSWSPHEIDILWDPYTEESVYIWRIPDDYRNLIKQGHLHHLERASWEVIQAVKNNQNLMFDKDLIYHMKERPLAGMRSRGWGISRVLTNFRQAWYVQILHRYNEAIALDYVIPFRLITPSAKAGASPESGDPVHSLNLGNFNARVQRMLQARRRDPARWNVLPFPVEYQALGGEATQLAPKELIDQGLDMLLCSIGVPVEFYKGTLSVQAAPAALRLMEANWSHLVYNLNRFLAKSVSQVTQLLSWEPVTARLARVTHADDLNRQMAKLQLMMGGQISKTEGLRSVGLDYQQQLRQMLEEERLQAEETENMQQEMEQAAQMDQMAMPQQPGQPMPGQPAAGAPVDPAAAGQPAPGAPAGAPPTGGMAGMTAVDMFIAAKQNTPNVAVSPEDLESRAHVIANQLMAMPESQRTSELIKLKRSDRTMHSLVRSLIDDMRQQAQTQGGEMVMQQQYGNQRHIAI